MNIFIVFLIGIIFILSFFLFKLLVDLRSINKQTEVKIHTDSRFTITSDIKMKEIVNLCNHLNELYGKYYNSQLFSVQKEKEFKEMLANIAHDVRTPLTSVQGYLQMLQTDNLSKEHNDYYKIINQRIYDIRNLLEQFFLYSKLINHDYRMEEKECHLYDVCCQSLASFYQKIVEKGIKPIIVFEQPDYVVIMNKEVLTRVFDNLFQNALIHGIGDIEIHQNKNTITVSNRLLTPVSLDVNKVFERFYKADTSRANITSGLGLSIVKEIIDLMGGEVKAEVQDDSFSIIIYFNVG